MNKITRNLKIEKGDLEDLSMYKLKKVVKASLETNLEKLILTTQDHRYVQGVVSVLKDLDNILTDSTS